MIERTEQVVAPTVAEGGSAALATRGTTNGLMTLLPIQMFPAPLGFIALYDLLLKIHLLNTLWGLVLAYLGGGVPWNAWLFKGYVDGLPRDLEESASVDGATNGCRHTVIDAHSRDRPKEPEGHDFRSTPSWDGPDIIEADYHQPALRE